MSNSPNNDDEARSGADRVLVGAIAGAFGVRGEARIKSFTEDPEALFSYSPLEDETGARRFTVQSWRVVKGGYAVRFKEIAQREEAEALKSQRLFAPSDRLPPLDEDEFYHRDLIGMAVEDLSGAALGRVKAVLNYGADDLLEIVGGPGLKRSQTWLLPFTKTDVVHVDLAKRLITADPAPGLVPDPSEPEPNQDQVGLSEDEGEAP